ncbi:MAG: NUDIX domain-containing protein [Chloroflexi bacterium]|nr:NUDIX domain-containing protein [Chloroflexota bacterium]
MRFWPGLLYAASRLRWRLMKPVTLGVRLILVKRESNRDPEILLVKHTYQKHWYLPGGGVKRGETLEEAARREAGEEVGAILASLRLFGIYTNFYEHKSDHVVVFVCNDFTLSGKTDHEIAEYGFFTFSDLPGDLSPGTRRRLDEYVKHDSVPIVGTW